MEEEHITHSHAFFKHKNNTNHIAYSLSRWDPGSVNMNVRGKRERGVCNNCVKVQHTIGKKTKQSYDVSVFIPFFPFPGLRRDYRSLGWPSPDECVKLRRVELTTVASTWLAVSAKNIEWVFLLWRKLDQIFRSDCIRLLSSCISLEGWYFRLSTMKLICNLWTTVTWTYQCDP